MKKWIQEELALKLDFVNWEFEIGWIWVIGFVLGEIVIKFAH